MKRQLSFLSILLSGLIILLSLLPMVFIKSYWQADTPGVGVYTHSWDKSVNLIASGHSLFAILILLLVAVGIYALVYQYADAENPLVKKLCFAPAAAFVLFGIFSFVVDETGIPDGTPRGTATGGYYGHYSFNFAFGWYLIGILLLAVAVIAVLIALGKIKNSPASPAAAAVPTPAAPPVPVPEAAPAPSAIPSDELTKLKELLDKGVITQEEFEAKKKQLLGL